MLEGITLFVFFVHLRVINLILTGLFNYIVGKVSDGGKTVMIGNSLWELVSVGSEYRAWRMSSILAYESFAELDNTP